MHFILLKYIHNIIRYMCFFIKTGSTCPALTYQRLFHLKLYYEPLQTIEKYKLLQYTIFQLKITSHLYFRMLNMVNYKINKNKLLIGYIINFYYLELSYLLK